MSDKDKGYVNATNIALGISLIASVGGGFYLYGNLNTAREQIELLKKENEMLKAQLEDTRKSIGGLSFNMQALTNTFGNRIESLERSFQLSFDRSERPAVKPKKITLPPRRIEEEEIDDDDEEAILAKMREDEQRILSRR